ncbi:hypothetical protein KKB99_06935, partial [bacterium]|nr:hypothetical protein [bacterium]MBU1025725.1 hypothetical protein [bacterium]
MRNKFFYLTACLIVIASVSGCGDKNAMRQTKDKNPQGLANMHHQVDYANQKGKSALDITEDMKYPGIQPYENAKYEFISGDSPQTVADWYKEHLKGSDVKKLTGKQSGQSKWIITQ